MVLFKNIERVAMMVLHADSAKNRTDGTRSTALFANHLTHIRGGNAQAQHSAFVSLNRLYNDLLGNIY